MHKYLNLNKDIFKITTLFLIWRMVIILIMILAIMFVPLGYKDRFLGGGPVNYSLSPEFFSWANFDGEHYLSIAIYGYKNLEQTFFPVYPMMISALAKPISYDFSSRLVNSTIIGLIISNISFFFSLLIVWKLVAIDFSKKIAFFVLLLLIMFPTSFYFGSLYNESFYLLISLLCFYNARRGNWFLAGLFGMVASATRIFGILLLPALILEAYQQKANLKKSFWLLLIPLGLVAYMIYQYKSVGDPLAFYHLQKLIGEQRQSPLTLFPQVFFRYTKMIITVDRNNPIYQTVVLEFLAGLLFIAAAIYGYFRKVRKSYILYTTLGFLLTSVQGSLSSVPRYVLVFFPIFIVLALWLERLPIIFRVIFLLVLTSSLMIETALFLRGYWVA